MQTLKTDIRQTILHAARREFLTNGFKNASMRNISKNAEVTLSNIYNYFRNKDEIFCEVLKPLLNAFNEMLENHNTEDYITLDVFTMKSYQREMIEGFMKIFRNYRAELKMLFFQVAGSSLENFRDEFTDRQTLTGLEYMQLMKQKYPHVNNDVSRFFIHIMGSWWLTAFGEIVSHEELTDAEIEQFVSEYAAFGTAGWKEVMKA